jgi:hypothetical protein
MVETPQTRQHIPACFGVALFAIISQIALVGIVVARVAIGEGHIGKVLKLLAISDLFLMAFGTIHIDVLSF